MAVWQEAAATEAVAVVVVVQEVGPLAAVLRAMAATVAEA